MTFMVGSYTAIKAADALRSGEFTSAELLQSTFDAIDAHEHSVRSFISLSDRDELIRTAETIDARRARGEELPRFAGVPIAIKDNIAVDGQRATCGSRMLETYTSPYNATAVQRVLDAGLLIVGKTNMDEFGFGSSTENSAFQLTRNPVDLDRVPGGSSGGSAAAVAAGFVPWALGTDTGGSVRQPAALCGVVGVRPTYGRVSRHGLVAYSSSMDQIGPIARSVDDAAELLSIVMGHDPLDSTSLPEDIASLRVPTDKVRIGIPEQYLGDACQPEVIAAVEQTARIAADLGWEVSSISLPLTDHALSMYYIISSVEAASNLARYDGGKYGYHPTNAATWGELSIRARTEGFGAEAKRRIMLGTYASSAGYADQFYLRATHARTLLRQEFASAFENVDIILSPISPTTAWPLGERSDDPMKMYMSDIHSVPGALAGLPSTVIPTGHDNAGLPVGVQLTGPSGGDARTISVARALEQVISFTPKSLSGVF